MIRLRAASRSQLRVVSPLRDFLAAESAGAVLLVVAAVAALLWANSPWSETYESFWQSKLSMTLAAHTLALELRHWVNDGSMTIFFLLVGLEIKREMVDGHLASLRLAALPAIAALGGVLVPAVLFLGIAGGDHSRGWAVPVATDIALAVGVLALGGSRVPAALRAFLLGLAIVDDIVAIVIIAVFYSDGVGLYWLGGFAASLVVAVAGRTLGVYHQLFYWSCGAAGWFFLHEAGIHPTLAGVSFGLLAPTTPQRRAELGDIDALVDVSTVRAAHETIVLARGTISVVEWLQHVLHRWSSFVIVPVFALANAGIAVDASTVRSAAGSRLAWAIVIGLVVGKPIGIVAASTVARRARLADQPAGVDRARFIGASAAGGIGFTVALFIAELAFDDEAVLAQAKLAVLVASVVAAVLATVLLRRPARPPRSGQSSVDSGAAGA